MRLFPGYKMLLGVTTPPPLWFLNEDLCIRKMCLISGVTFFFILFHCFQKCFLVFSTTAFFQRLSSYTIDTHPSFRPRTLLIPCKPQQVLLFSSSSICQFRSKLTTPALLAHLLIQTQYKCSPSVFPKLALFSGLAKRATPSPSDLVSAPLCFTECLHPSESEQATPLCQKFLVSCVIALRSATLDPSSSLRIQWPKA